MWSDAHPHKMSVGVPMTRPTPIAQAEVRVSTFITVCRKNSAQNWLEYQTTPSPNTTMDAITTYLRFCGLRKTSRQGFLLVLPLALISSYTGDSSKFRRIYIVTISSRNEHRNGMRQAQSLNTFSPK